MEDINYDLFLNNSSFDPQSGFLLGGNNNTTSTSSNKGKQAILPDLELFQQHQQQAFQQQYRSRRPSSQQYFQQQQQQDLYNPPSHQYNLFKQQSTFAPGALQNAIPQQVFLGGNSSSSSQDTPMLYRDNDVLVNSAFVDVNPLINIDTASPDFYDMNMMMDDVMADYTLDPSALNGSSSSSDLSPTVHAPARLYPGIHSAQAAARAQEQIKMQQTMQPTSLSAAGAAAKTFAEERISRLLESMRNNAAVDDDEDLPAPKNTGGRAKKSEEEMDEDERLLNSEEGKKLSSKERRQLRNKVSARAFRSRRKEYIGQLEEEISLRITEAETFRAENDALRAENTRLTDLTRTLLAHPGFQSFIHDPALLNLTSSLKSTSTSTSNAQPSRSRQTSLAPSAADRSKASTPLPRPMKTISEESESSDALALTPKDSSKYSFATPVYALYSVPDEPVINGQPTSQHVFPAPISASSTSKLQAPQSRQRAVSSAAAGFDTANPAYTLYGGVDTRRAVSEQVEIGAEMEFESEMMGFVGANGSDTGSGRTEDPFSKFMRLTGGVDGLE